VGSTITSLNSGSAVSLSAGIATLTGVRLSGIGTHTITANYGGVSNTFKTSSNTATVTLSKASVTVTGPATQPVTMTSGHSGSVTITVAGSNTTLAAPTGTLSYSILNSSGTSAGSGTPALVAGNSSSTTSIAIPSTLASGTYTINVTYSGDSNYLASSTATAIEFTIGQVTPSISWTPSAGSIVYGTSLTGILNATATSGSTAVAGTFTYTAMLAGGSATPITSGSVLVAGGYTLTAAFTPVDGTTYTSATKTVPLNVGQATPTVGLTSTVNPAMATSAVTFTASVASSSGTPTGTVSFLDGTTLLGAVTLSGGAAAFTTSSLAAGTHTITAVYAGDANFASVTTSPVTEVIQDFSLSPSGSGASTPTQTVSPGGTASYSLVLGPLSGTTFPNAVTLSVSGLPPGATATITPNTIPAGSPLTDVSLTIQLPQTTAKLPNQGIPPVAWCVLLLPFAGRLGRAGKRMRRTMSVLLLAAAALAVGAGVSGCGSTSNGFFGHPQQTYSVVITATSGSISHSTTVSLIVR
jgi:Bacterial Ig-like domain (group 3)